MIGQNLLGTIPSILIKLEIWHKKQSLPSNTWFSINKTIILFQNECQDIHKHVFSTAGFYYNTGRLARNRSTLH